MTTPTSPEAAPEVAPETSPLAEGPTSTPFTIGMVTIDCTEPTRLAAFWSQATGCPVVADHGSFAMVGCSPTLGFQRVDDPTPGKNRVHLDGGGGGRAEQVARLVGLGAVEHETNEVEGFTWTVMSDPEGNLFCVGDPHH